MYNMVFGSNQMGPVLLAALGLDAKKVGRYRDAFVTEGKIAIYTRNGGGNRECWSEGEVCDPPCPGCIIENELPKHPLYLYDEDDDFDCTYATIYFKFPEEHREWLEALDQGKVNMSDKWIEAIEALKTNVG